MRLPLVALMLFTVFASPSNNSPLNSRDSFKPSLSSRQVALSLTGLASVYVLYVIIKSYKSKRLQMILSETDDDNGYEY